ncbi:MAG TPA: S8 family peptidase [Thermoleophilaceae bacterium]|nr:S8 family peptidase [Thermoleophilaceae bacterium]
MRHRRELMILAAVGAALSAPAPAGAAERVLVGFDKGVSKERQGKIVGELGGRIEKRFAAVRGGRLVAVNARGGRRLDAVRKVLRKADGVTYAEPDFTLSTAATRTPNDPDYPFQYAVANSATGAISAPEAWGTRTSCSTVAVLDTGIDTDHPDLAPNIYKSSDKPNNGKDDDKNGYVDDTYGLNVIKGKGSGEDDNGHGSHVSGIIGGRGNNGTGVSGICWSTKLMAVKFMNSKGKGSTSDAIDGIQYAAKKGAKVINCSFGSSSKSSALHDAVDYAQSKGSLLVVAAGNDGDNIDKKPEYPASYTDSNILTVAATTSTDTLASFSNYGSTAVDVAAPGNQILSTYLGGGYKLLSGTSMASPYAAGTAAMLRKQESGATYSDLRYAIRHKVDTPPALKGKVAYNGRLNAQRALAAIGSLVD